MSQKNTNKDLIIMLETFERSPDPIAGIKFPAKYANKGQQAT